MTMYLKLSCVQRQNTNHRKSNVRYAINYKNLQISQIVEPTLAPLCHDQFPFLGPSTFQLWPAAPRLLPEEQMDYRDDPVRLSISAMSAIRKPVSVKRLRVETAIPQFVTVVDVAMELLLREALRKRRSLSRTVHPILASSCDFLRTANCCQYSCASDTLSGRSIALQILLKAIEITLIRLREVYAVDSIIIIILFKKNQTRVPGRPSLADPSDTIEIVSPLCIHPFTLLPPPRCPPIICTRAPTNYFIRTSFTDEATATKTRFKTANKSSSTERVRVSKYYNAYQTVTVADVSGVHYSITDDTPVRRAYMHIQKQSTPRRGGAFNTRYTGYSAGGCAMHVIVRALWA
ncbi:hypothetical protein EAG_09987 [Camponotus floridanus]|uniref:Uncharacterized protein n=1 Tax=Camponotus floridanus TaxID=104421 RepID=E1ZY35_CAMFO|nr:hypothetical protein EAG_09987 [Camponotus floridanus]